MSTIYAVSFTYDNLFSSWVTHPVTNVTPQVTIYGMVHPTGHGVLAAGEGFSLIGRPNNNQHLHTNIINWKQQKTMHNQHFNVLLFACLRQKFWQLFF